MGGPNRPGSRPREDAKGPAIEASEGAEGPAIEALSAKALFAELLGASLERVDLRPSPMAIAYLIQLLESHLRSPEANELTEAARVSLVEALELARRDAGQARLRQLRALGDHALFQVGLCGPHLERRAVDSDYVGRIGSTAYADLSTHLSAESRREAPWRELFCELSGEFDGFVDLLSEVADRTHGQVTVSALGDRYLQTGRESDRRRLIARGVHVAVPPRGGHRQ